MKKLSDILKENDIYNKNPKIKNIIEVTIPQLCKMISQKINSDDYRGAAELSNKLTIISNQLSKQINLFVSQNSNKIKNTEL